MIVGMCVCRSTWAVVTWCPTLLESLSCSAWLIDSLVPLPLLIDVDARRPGALRENKRGLAILMDMIYRDRPAQAGS